jgi:hypothetical protein
MRTLSTSHRGTSRPPATQSAENSPDPSPMRSSIWPMSPIRLSPSSAAQTCCITGASHAAAGDLVLLKRRPLILDLVRLYHWPDFVRDRDHYQKGLDWMGGTQFISSIREYQARDEEIQIRGWEACSQFISSMPIQSYTSSLFLEEKLSLLLRTMDTIVVSRDCKSHGRQSCIKSRDLFAKSWACTFDALFLWINLTATKFRWFAIYTVSAHGRNTRPYISTILNG